MGKGPAGCPKLVLKLAFGRPVQQPVTLLCIGGFAAHYARAFNSELEALWVDGDYLQISREVIIDF